MPDIMHLMQHGHLGARIFFEVDSKGRAFCFGPGLPPEGVTFPPGGGVLCFEVSVAHPTVSDVALLSKLTRVK